jgi:hypothetical protein
MKKVWDDTLDRPFGGDGRSSYHGFLEWRKQAERWAAGGYDVAAAVDRERVFLLRYRVAMPLAESCDMILRHFAGERAIALASGVAADDEDLWRIDRAPKAFDPPDHLVAAPVMDFASEPLLPGLTDI